MTSHLTRGLRLWLARGALAFGLASAPLSPTVQAQVPATEASVKAAYLHKFLPYVEWPASAMSAPDSPLVIAVAGADEVLAELKPMLVQRHINGREVVARRLDEEESVDDLHVVFIGRAANLPRLAQRLRGRPVLMVTESARGLEAGAMLNFLLVEGRVRFEAAPAAADRAGIKLGSRLLAVAERVLAR